MSRVVELLHEADGDAGVDESDGFASRCKERDAGLIEPERVDASYRRVTVGERRGVKWRQRAHGIGGVFTVIDEAHLCPDALGQLASETRVEEPQHVNANVPRSRDGDECPERCQPQAVG